MRRQDGFTLVEALMAGALSTVLGGAILTVLYLCNDMMEESLAKAKLASQYEVAAETIHRIAREAYCVTGDNEGFADCGNPPPSGNQSRLDFYRRNGTLIGGFSVTDADPFLREGADNFKIAGDSLAVINPFFGILGGRRAVTFSMTLRMTQGGKTYTLTSPNEVALCRNNLR